jgi:hypothetical protein
MRIFLTARVFSGVHALSNSPKHPAHQFFMRGMRLVGMKIPCPPYMAAI